MKAKRIDEIEKLVIKNESASIQELCEFFDVSINTIRRDIDELVKRGTIEKVYGGIRAKKLSVPLLPFEQRNDRQREQKEIIGKVASNYFNNGDIVFIDSGTTTSQIMKYIDPQIKLTVLTNSLDVINECAHFSHITLFVIGSLYKNTTRSFVEMNGNSYIHNFNINKAFMAATWVSITNGLTNSDPLEYEIKKIMCERANEIFLLVDDSKFGKSTLLTYSPLSEVSTFISSNQTPAEYRNYFQEHGITFIAADM